MLLPPMLLALVLGAPPTADKEAPPRASGVAPSLPALTIKEEDRLDEIIDRFIQADIGKLRGPDGQKAVKDFDTLGTESIPALIRGLNRAAELDHSCPTLVIKRKLMKMLLASQDLELLDYARENIGAGVVRSSHAGSLNDLRVQLMLRKNALVRLGSTGPKPVASLTTTELVRSASSEKGVRQKQVLTELATRRGAEALTTLTGLANSAEPEMRTFALDLVERNLSRQSAAVIKERLTDANVDVRKASIRVASRTPALVGEVIDLLDDGLSEVREEAHAALVKLARGRISGRDPMRKAATDRKLRSSGEAGGIARNDESSGSQEKSRHVQPYGSLTHDATFDAGRNGPYPDDYPVRENLHLRHAGRNSRTRSRFRRGRHYAPPGRQTRLHGRIRT